MIPDYLAAFGLAFDPFAPGSEGGEFFVGAQREELLEQLIHLVQFSDSVCVVEGDFGSGRTTLKQELAFHFSADPDGAGASEPLEATDLSGQWYVCDLDASALSAPEQLFGGMAQALGCEMSSDASAGELLSALRQQLQNAPRQPVLLLLDNAHLLDDGILSALLSLGQPSLPDQPQSLHMVLFGELGLTERLDGFGMVDVLLQDLVLPLLTLDDLAEYLFVKMSAAGWQQALPFDDDELNRLLAVSKGIPGGVHDAARAMLMDKAEQQPEPETRGLGLPVAHMFSLVVLLGILLMAFFYKDSWFGREQAPASVEAPPQDQRRTVSVPLAESQPVIRDTQSHNDKDAVVGAVGSSLPSGIDSGAGSGLGTDSGEEPALAPNASGQAEPSAATVAQSDVESDVVATIVQERDEPTIVKNDRAEAPASVSVENAASENAKPAAPMEAYSADEQALLRVDQSHYVLQVMAASSKSSVEAFVRRQPNKQDLRLFTSLRAGKPWFVVVAGDFSGLEAARKGVTLLPSEQRKAGPWPRRVAEVQSKIREYHSI